MEINKQSFCKMNTRWTSFTWILLLRMGKAETWFFGNFSRDVFHRAYAFRSSWLPPSHAPFWPSYALSSDTPHCSKINKSITSMWCINFTAAQMEVKVWNVLAGLLREKSSGGSFWVLELNRGGRPHHLDLSFFTAHGTDLNFWLHLPCLLTDVTNYTTDAKR